MKKTLLLSAVAAMALSASAQVDITPANYKFSTATKVPMMNVFFNNPNIVAGSSDVWTAAGLGEHFDGGLIVNSSAGQNEAQQEAFRNAWQLVNFGGEVGQVLMFTHKASGIVDKLNELAPEMADEWAKIKPDEASTEGFRIHFYTDPETCPSTSQGYIHVKMVYNIYSNNAGVNNNVFTSVFHATNANGNDFKDAAGGNHNTNSEAKIIAANECMETYDDGEPVLDDDDNPVWDPHKWMVYEFDFCVSDPEDGKPAYTPARISMQAPGGAVWNNYTFFVKELTLTQMPGKPSGSNYTKSETTFDDVLTPNSTAIGSIAGETIAASYTINGNTVSFTAPAAVYNLIGQKVAQGTTATLNKGVYVAKVGDKNVKFIIR